MTKTERLIPLTTQDIENLKARKGGGIGCFWIFVVATTILFVFLSLLAWERRMGYGDFDLFNTKIDIPGGILILPFFLVVIIAAYFIYRRYGGTAGKDIKGGKKKVVTTQVAKLFKENLDPSNKTTFAIKTAYMVDIDGVHYDVKEEDYQKFTGGMWVELHTGPRSGAFLGIYEPETGRLLAGELV